MMWFRKAKPLNLEQQLGLIAECGIKLRPDLSKDDLLATASAEQFEKEPFLLLLTMLGGEQQQEPFSDYSDNIWHFKKRCIKDTGSYCKVAARLARLTGGTMPITDAIDYVSHSEQKAWLSFVLDGMQYRWDLSVNGDFIDPRMLSRFADLLKLVGAGKRFFYLELKGQDYLIASGRPDQLGLLREKSELDFQWLV